MPRQNPDKVNVGHPGNGTLGHITSELIQQFAGVKMTNVPYRGSAPLITDLLGGDSRCRDGFHADLCAAGGRPARSARSR